MILSYLFVFTSLKKDLIRTLRKKQLINRHETCDGISKLTLVKLESIRRKITGVIIPV